MTARGVAGDFRTVSGWGLSRFLTRGERLLVSSGRFCFFRAGGGIALIRPQ